nr:Otopetrin domain containing protein [Haemonchus contortus]
MHLIAANLWTWIRYVLLEEGAMEKEIREVFHVIHSQNESGMDKATADAFEHRDIESGCQSVECMLGSVSEMMYAAIVEYSLIAAAVMYIVWKNIGRVHYNSEYVKRKYHVRMDCSNTTTGLFLGLIFLIGTFSSMLIYYGYSILGESTSAAFAYAITDIVQVPTLTGIRT